MRVASLYLPLLPIERLRRASRQARPPEAAHPRAHLPLPVDDDPGACSVPRGGGWRPGARWARDGALGDEPSPAQIAALPIHQRPTMHEMGRRSEHAEHPFKAMPADEWGGGGGNAFSLLTPGQDPWVRPLILIAREGQRETITATCPAALALGLHPGMAAAQARALVADLEVQDADLAADRAILDRLALHAVGHWTPNASVADGAGLWLDLTGSSHLFGGEARFCQRLLRFLHRLGLTGAIAIAGTPGAAHALARYSGRMMTILPPGQESEALGGLPLAALRLTPDALIAASRFGLERIGDLYAMPRGPLARRLGLGTVHRLDQARGLVAEPIVPVVPFEQPQALRRLLEPISTVEAIAQVIGDLVDDLVTTLERRGMGLRTAVLTYLRVDSCAQRLSLGTARATRDARHLKRMLVMRIERIEPGLGIEAMLLAAPHVEDLQPMSLAAVLGNERQIPDIAPLLDQLAGRIGTAALFRMQPQESDVPERAVCRAAPLAKLRGWPTWPRPARLLKQPEPLHHVMALLPDHPPRQFQWRGKVYRVMAGDGPERIHGEWWRTGPQMWAIRDYYRVETQGGARFWLFRRGDGVDADTGDLSWHLHGVF